MPNTCTAVSNRVIFYVVCCDCFSHYFKPPLTTKSSYTLKTLHSLIMNVFLFREVQSRSKHGCWRVSEAEVDRSRLDVGLKLKKRRQFERLAAFRFRWRWASITCVLSQTLPYNTYMQFIDIHILHLALKCEGVGLVANELAVSVRIRCFCVWTVSYNEWNGPFFLMGCSKRTFNFRRKLLPYVWWHKASFFMCFIALIHF